MLDESCRMGRRVRIWLGQACRLRIVTRDEGRGAVGEGAQSTDRVQTECSKYGAGRRRLGEDADAR